MVTVLLTYCQRRDRIDTIADGEREIAHILIEFERMACFDSPLDYLRALYLHTNDKEVTLSLEGETAHQSGRQPTRINEE